MRTRSGVPVAVPWALVALAILVPAGLATTNPFLAYRTATYIVAGAAGIACLALFLVQPLLAAGWLPGLGLPRARRWHRRVGAAIVALVAAHVGLLYLTSPDDTMDALLLVAPTPFSLYGVLAMWGVVVTAALVLVRRRVPHAAWRFVHNALALGVVAATVVHAVQIEGAMEIVSKWALCLGVLLATAGALLDVWLVRRTTAAR